MMAKVAFLGKLGFISNRLGLVLRYFRPNRIYPGGEALCVKTHIEKHEKSQIRQTLCLARRAS